MRRILYLILTIMCLLVSPTAIFAQIFNPGNGHYYELVSTGGINWYDARDAAPAMTYNGMQGHLAVVTSSEENSWIASTFSVIGNDGERAWIGGTDEANEGTWLWITKETWGFTNWDIANGEPNGDTDENCLQYKNGDTWNDEACDGDTVLYYLVEFEPSTAVPTMSEWGMIIFMMFAGLGSVYYLRRRIRT